MIAQTSYQTKSLKDVAVNYLTEKILTGEYKPNEKINEVQVAKELGISRAPIREGIKELSSQGLVKQIPRKGTYVVELTEKDIKEIYQIRLSLESCIIDKIIDNDKLNEKDFKFLEDKIELMEETANSDDDFNTKKIKINKEDIKFHKYIWEKADSPRRLKILFDLHLQLQMAMLFDTEMTGDLKNTAETHKDIVKHLRAGDAKKAKAALVEHIEMYKLS
ncbi:GntR family transcriptional regulator [Halanaerobium congolense]|uniref:GntR family transcriptional regulator n=1 Tax=Halanaerobium congolense TaxID=54121 RepID=UPI00088CAEA9|nr:GntR family transcriptional regulator [Halanaerobium congolense]SDH01129.1 DNA-binding transcriptional regulator, GntR family [Halanaerobium congolense]